MARTLMERLTAKPEGMRLYQQERAILEVTELICEAMEEQNVNRADLARRLGRSRGYITQLLDGRANMTIRTISDVFTALDRALHFQDGPLSTTTSEAPILFRKLDWLSSTIARRPPHFINVPAATGSGPARLAG